MWSIRWQLHHIVLQNKYKSKLLDSEYCSRERIIRSQKLRPLYQYSLLFRRMYWWWWHPNIGCGWWVILLCKRFVCIRQNNYLFCWCFMYHRLITVLFARISPKFKYFCRYNSISKIFNCYLTEFILFYADALHGWQLVCERIIVLTSVL